MIEAKHSQAFAIVCVGLTVGLLLSPRGAIADDDVTVKHILRRAQSEAELSAVREFIETLTGDARKVEPKSEGAVLPGQGSHGIDAESETNNLAQPAASTAYEAPQANLKTSGIAPRNGLVTGETNTRTPSAEPLDAAAAPTRQPYDPTAVETGASELSAVTDLPSRHDRDAEPQRDSGEKVHSDSFTVPPASTAEDPVQSETAVSAVAPEALERDTNQVKPSVATSSSEAAAQHGGSTVPSAAIVSVPPGPAPREMADISTENEADGRRPSAVHEQGGAEEKAVSDITAQALLVKKERLAKPVKDFAPLPVSIRNLTPDEALARAAEQQIPSVNIEIYFQRGRANLSKGTFLLLGAVGRALSDPQLKTTIFMIAGHSDAKGRRETNLLLSAQRAQAVREFLVRNFDIDPDRLVAKGFGEDHPKDPRQPNADINRRVQIINLPDEIAAGR